MHGESRETAAIRKRMAEVRCELQEDMQDAADGARVLSDWRHYVKNYPLVCIGAALAIGYVMVPRRPTVRIIGHALTDMVQKQTPRPARLNSLLGSAGHTLLAFAGKLVVRNVIAYVDRRTGERRASLAAESQSRNLPNGSTPDPHVRQQRKRMDTPAAVSASLPNRKGDEL